MFITQNTCYIGDSLMHFLIAQSVAAYLLNLLHVWSKRVYTLLTAGPAQLG